jgi:NAD(P)-dependent dehydrogenase (short-subunit alcohol dehydrogenase family)
MTSSDSRPRLGGVARLAEPAPIAPARTFPAQPRPIVKATDLGSAQVLKHLDLFLVSDASSYVMGQSILIDGAYTAV